MKARWSAAQLAEHRFLLLLRRILFLLLQREFLLFLLLLHRFLLGAAAVHKIVPLIRAAREQKEAKKKKLEAQ